ncbi:MAG: hypothetical protein ACYCZO_13700 [Daejeonella sp.]
MKSQYLSTLFIATVFLFTCCSQKSGKSTSNDPILSRSIPDTIKEKMIWIPEGSFTMGSNDPAFADARPGYPERFLDG